MPKFVLHEHWAKQHHFDLRLEHCGVLKSWALPKGMPVKVGDKHLAVQTFNHPMWWYDFKGKIAEGRYGAGEVKIKDRGAYTLLKWIPHIDFVLNGKVFKGKYALVPMRGSPMNWLLIRVSNR